MTGIYAPPERAVSADGFELVFATNHLGHFLSTELLLPLLKKSKEMGNHPRINVVSSNANTYFQMTWDDLQSERGYNSLKTYSRSKLANVLHGKELAKRLEPLGILVCILHPGFVRSSIFRGNQS